MRRSLRSRPRNFWPTADNLTSRPRSFFFRCRRWGLTVAWAVTLLLETLLLGPSLAAGLEGKDLAGVLGSPVLRWAWSLGVVLALAGIVALAMIAEQLDHEPRHRCRHCDWQGDSQPALAGHLRACAGRRGGERAEG